MSDIHDAEADSPEIDLSDVPMDGADEGHDREVEGPEGQDEDAGEGQAQARAPLEPDELQKRYDNSRIALRQERQERRDLERRLAALEGRATTPQPQRQAEEEAEIDPDVDPLGALKQMRAKIAAYEAEEKRAGETEAQRTARERQYAQVEADLTDHEADFRETHGDYDDAAKHYTSSRAQELMHIGLTPQQVALTLREEFIALAQRAIQARKNPAAVVYELAKGRGYAAGHGPQAKTGQAPERGPDGKFKPGGKLDALASGQKAASPLGKAGGRANPNLDARTVANINIRDKKGGEAFDKAFAALERAEKARERA